MLSPLRWSPHRPLARHVRLASDSVCAPPRGRNLSERYRKLENTACATHDSLLSQSWTSVAEPHVGVAHVPTRTPIPPDTISGFVIPKEPREPADDECCMSGCAVCVYDLYEEELVAYKESVTTLRSALFARHIPESEWPAHIRTGTETQTSPTPTLTTTERSKGAVLSAFEEMERALKEKREKRAAVEADKRARGDGLACDGEQVGVDLQGVYEGLKWVIFPNR